VSEPEHVALTQHDEVGVSLAAGAEADAVLEVLTTEPGAAVRVDRRATYVRIETDAPPLVIRYDDVADVLGYPFGPGEFQAILSAYYGRPALAEDSISFHAAMTAGVLDEDIAAATAVCG
jgi:hypothetical protein